MLTKQHLTKFALLFVFATLIFVSVGAIFQKTGVDQRKGHITKSFEDPKYIANTFYKGNNFLASKDGKVDAAVNPITTMITAVKLYRDYQQWVENPSNKTFVGATGESGLNAFALGPSTGCDSFGAITEDVKAGPDATHCFDSAPMNSVDYGELSDAGNKSQASFLGFLNTGTYLAFAEADTITNNSLYAKGMVEQVPFVGQKANAFFEDPFGKNTFTISWMKRQSLGEGFYNLWVSSRNLTYYLIIIPTVAFGLAIMFRVQIGPQTQVTLMQAIPQLLVVILLITFSYPLISLMINLAEPIRDVGVSLIFKFAQSVTASQSGVVVGASSSIIYTVFLIAALLPGFSVPGGMFVIISALFFFVFIIVVWLRYLFNLAIIIIKLGFFIGFGPLIIVWAALPGKMDLAKNYFINVASLVFGVVAMSIAYSAFFAVIQLGVSIGPLSAFIFFFVACGILWKAPGMQKQLAQAMGVKPLFGGGQDPRKR